MKRLFAIIFCLPLLLSACVGITQPVAVPDIALPPGPPVSQPGSSATKIVEMVTEDPLLTPPAPVTQPGTTPMPGSSGQASDPNPQPASGGVNPASTPPGPPGGNSMPMPLTARGVKIATYQDAASGFAIDYPDGWTVTDLSAQQKQDAQIYSVSLRSPAPPPGPKQQDGLPTGMTAVDITVVKNGPKTLEQAINERRAAVTAKDGSGSATITAEADWTLQGSLPAHRFLVATGPDRTVAEMVTMINGRMILVSGSGDLSLWEAVAASLRAAGE